MKESRYNTWVSLDEVDYVFNGVSGKSVRVTKQDRAELGRFIAGDDTVAVAALKELVEARALVNDDLDELAMLETRYQLSRYDPYRLGLTIVSSLGCNFDCPYCFESKHPSILGAEEQAAILRLLDDSVERIRSFGVTWFGGEPLLGKRSLLALSDEFIERCDRHGVEYGATILTNGWLLDETTCRELADRRVQRAQVVLDGPPDVHDRMRPLVSGKPTFERIVDNLTHAVDHLSISVRMNISRDNSARAEELLQILADRGLAGRLTVYPGQLVGYDDNLLAPASSFSGSCFSNAEFARAEREFLTLATGYGFAAASLPTTTGAPCTAVRANELVVGSDGELYKCYDDVGNPREVVGNIRDYADPNGRLAKWLSYDPFADEECRGCIALPVCMGGCAHHGLRPKHYENRCGTFRHTAREQVMEVATATEARRRLERDRLPVTSS